MKALGDGSLSENSGLCLSVWDYGGQTLFRSVHHLFLTRFGLYVLCFNMEDFDGSKRESEALQDLEFWLNALALHVDVNHHPRQTDSLGLRGPPSPPPRKSSCCVSTG